MLIWNKNLSITIQELEKILQKVNKIILITIFLNNKERISRLITDNDNNDIFHGSKLPSSFMADQILIINKTFSFSNK